MTDQPTPLRTEPAVPDLATALRASLDTAGAVVPAGTAASETGARTAADAEVDTLREELARTRRAARTLGGIVSAQARTFYAAWIDIKRGDRDSACQWVLNSVPDVWDGEPWNGTETGDEWFVRTDARVLAGGDAASTPTGAPPGQYAGGERSPLVWVFLCPRCGGYPPHAPADGILAHCDGTGETP